LNSLIWNEQTFVFIGLVTWCVWKRCPLLTDARIKRVWNDTVYIFVEDFDLVIDTEQLYKYVKIRSLPCTIFQRQKHH